MTEQEYEALTAYQASPERIGAHMLLNRKPRTLIWGYDVDRNSFHAYLGNDGKIHIVLYAFEGYLLSHKTEDEAAPREYVPNKRVYPAACDLEFCRILMDADVSIPFTTFEARQEAAFYGDVLEELIEIPESYAPPVVQVSVEDFDLPEDSRFHSYPHLRDALERGIPGAVAEMVRDFHRRVVFKKEDPEQFRDHIARRLGSIVSRVEYDNDLLGEGNPLALFKLSDKAKATLVPRVMAVLEEGAASR